MEYHDNLPRLSNLLDTGDDLVDDKQVRAFIPEDLIVEHHIPFSDSSLDIWDELQVERWKWVRPLGRGGFGQVHLEEKVFERFTSTQSGPKFRAVKIISDKNGVLKARQYLPEILGMAKFSKLGASFIQLFAWFQIGTEICISMEWAPYGDLEDCVQDSLPEADAKEIMRQVTQAVLIMHQKHFLHRDLKPKNVFVFKKRPESTEWRVKLGDFGVSKRVRLAANTSWHTTIEADCSAPEVLGMLDGDFTEESSYANPVDMWSLGYLTHWLLTRTFPVSKFDLNRLCRNMTPISLANLDGKGVSESGIDFVRELLHLDPNSRMTAAEAHRHTWLASTFGHQSIHGRNLVSFDQVGMAVNNATSSRLLWQANSLESGQNKITTGRARNGQMLAHRDQRSFADRMLPSPGIEAHNGSGMVSYNQDDHTPAILNDKVHPVGVEILPIRVKTPSGSVKQIYSSASTIEEYDISHAVLDHASLAKKPTGAEATSTSAEDEVARSAEGRSQLVEDRPKPADPTFSTARRAVGRTGGLLTNADRLRVSEISPGQRPFSEDLSRMTKTINHSLRGSRSTNGMDSLALLGEQGKHTNFLATVQEVDEKVSSSSKQQVDAMPEVKQTQSEAQALTPEIKKELPTPAGVATAEEQNQQGNAHLLKETRPKRGIADTRLPSKVPSVAQDILEQFRIFADSERARLAEGKKLQSIQDRQKRIDDLKFFSSTFQIKTPVPTDLIGILSNEPEKQKLIEDKNRMLKEKERQDIELWAAMQKAFEEDDRRVEERRRQDKALLAFAQDREQVALYTDYCYCDGKVQDAERISCDNPDCFRRWFHLTCAGLDSYPAEGHWLCHECASQQNQTSMTQTIHPPNIARSVRSNQTALEEAAVRPSMSPASHSPLDGGPSGNKKRHPKRKGRSLGVVSP